MLTAPAQVQWPRTFACAEQLSQTNRVRDIRLFVRWTKICGLYTYIYVFIYYNQTENGATIAVHFASSGHNEMELDGCHWLFKRHTPNRVPNTHGTKKMVCKKRNNETVHPKTLLCALWLILRLMWVRFWKFGWFGNNVYKSWPGEERHHVGHCQQHINVTAVGRRIFVPCHGVMIHFHGYYSD